MKKQIRNIKYFLKYPRQVIATKLIKLALMFDPSKSFVSNLRLGGRIYIGSSTSRNIEVFNSIVLDSDTWIDGSVRGFKDVTIIEGR